MKECFYSPRARRDFSDILDYMGESDPDSGLDFVTRLQLTCEQLAQMPGMGRKRDDLAKELRSFPVEKQANQWQQEGCSDVSKRCFARNGPGHIH